MSATFKKGDRVRLTERGIQQGLAPWGYRDPHNPVLGWVVSDQKGLQVRVRRDRTKVPGGYHINFWDRY